MYSEPIESMTQQYSDTRKVTVARVSLHWSIQQSEI